MRGSKDDDRDEDVEMDDVDEADEVDGDGLTIMALVRWWFVTGCLRWDRGPEQRTESSYPIAVRAERRDTQDQAAQFHVPRCKGCLTLFCRLIL